MSGPLAEWCAVHSKAGPVGVAVLVQLALNCHHDGSNAYAPTWDELQHRTRYKRAAVAKGLREVETLGEAVPTRRGGGAGLATPYRLPFTLCDPIDSCPPCAILAANLPQKGLPGGPFPGEKGPRDAKKGLPDGPTTVRNPRETTNQRLARLAAPDPDGPS